MPSVPLLNQGEKHALVLSYAAPYGILVETGLWAGNGATTSLVNNIARCYAIDSQHENVIAARERGVEAFEGDSAVMLPQLLKRIDGPACFWLDAHYVVEGDEFLATHPCPLLVELDAIQAWPFARESTVLIDDLRMMGSPGWPTIEHVRVKVAGWWTRLEVADVMRLTPRA